MSDEARFSEVWAGFDGTTREDITQDFQPDSYSRDDVYTGYKRYQWEGPPTHRSSKVNRELVFSDKTA